MKRITSKLLITTLFLCALFLTPFGMQSANAAIVYYDYDVTTGGQLEFDTSTGTIRLYSGSPTKLTIPSSINGVNVTSIGYRGFVVCPELTNIVIPNTVTSIGIDAFMQCTSLTDISIPNSVTTIGNGAFNSSSLISISIPSSVTSIGAYAFGSCYNLTSISIPNSLTSISDMMLMRCTNLTNISIPNSVTSIGGNAFNGCTSLTNISIPNSVTSIGGTPGGNAFNGCTSLTSISIPNSVINIGGGAFTGCTSLISITFNSKDTIITEYYGTIPPDTKIIGYDPSTAKAYATKYGNPFETIGTTITLPGPTTVSVESPINTGENVVINWTAATNATKYLVTLTPTSPSSWVVRWSTATGTSWNEGQLPAGTYDVMVTPFNGQVEGEDSNISSFEVIAPPPGSSKVSVNPTYTNSENIVIKWEPSQYADYYYIAVFTRNKNGSDGKLVYSNIDKITVTSVDIGKLPVGNYLARVVPVNSVGNGGACEAVFSVINTPKTSVKVWIDNYPEPWRSGTSDHWCYNPNGSGEIWYLDDWNYVVQNCTSWVAWALHDRNGFEMSSEGGNAANWGVWAKDKVNSTPAIGAVAWWAANTLDEGYNVGSFGHVAWVRKFDIKKGTVEIEEYNYGGNGAYHTRIMSISNAQYIHFKDIGK